MPNPKHRLRDNLIGLALTVIAVTCSVWGLATYKTVSRSVIPPAPIWLQVGSLVTSVLLMAWFTCGTIKALRALTPKGE